MEPDRTVLDALSLDYQELDSGCCGLAGAFGFDRHHYDVSMQVGQRVLLPAVRGADADTLVIADGFSCREQIAHGTARRAVHLAEVIRLAIAGERAEPLHTGAQDTTPAIADPAPAMALGLTTAGFLLAGIGAWRATRRRRLSPGRRPGEPGTESKRVYVRA